MNSTVRYSIFLHKYCCTCVQVWRDQILDFMAEFVNTPAVLVGNTIGSLAVLMVPMQLFWLARAHSGHHFVIMGPLHPICFTGLTPLFRFTGKNPLFQVSQLLAWRS